MSIFDTYGVTGMAEGLQSAREQKDAAEQMVSPVNAEIALKSLMDAELALTKARDLLRRSRERLMLSEHGSDADALLADINDLLGG